MENKLFIGMIVRVTDVSPDYEAHFEQLKTAVLYQDCDNVYTDLDEDFSYYTDEGKKLVIGDLVVDTSSLFMVNCSDFRPDYRYLINKHLVNGIRFYDEKKRRIFKKEKKGI